MATSLESLTPEEFVRASTIQVINQGNVEALDEHYAADADYYNSAHEAGDLETLKEDAQKFQAGFSDLESTVDEVVVDGETLCFRYTVSGLHTGQFEGVPPTNERISTQGIGCITLEDGEAIELDLVFDLLGMLQQLDVL